MASGATRCIIGDITCPGGCISIVFSVRILAGVLDMEEFQDIKMSTKRQAFVSFIQTGTLEDVSLVDEIIDMTDKYIRTK